MVPVIRLPIGTLISLDTLASVCLANWILIGIYIELSVSKINTTEYIIAYATWQSLTWSIVFSIRLN